MIDPQISCIACDVSGPESLVFNPVEGEEELDGTKHKRKKT